MIKFELIQRRSASWVANHCQTAAGGALIGAFEDMGISREDAPLYEEAVRRGVVIVAAEVDDPLEAEAITILKTRGGRQVREEVAQFDPHPHPIDSAV